MNKYLILLLLTVLPFQVLTDESTAVTTQGAFDQSHSLYSSVLGKYVKDGSVDYRGLKSNPDDLKNYLSQTSTITKGEFDKWTQGQQLAFLINVYNAETLDLVQENYPVASIKDIAKDSGGPWEQPIVRLFGKKITLNALENEIIRKNYPDPRIHFALVCAAIGCPVLTNKPYLGPSLNSQLEMQTRNFISDSNKNYIDTANKTLHLSPIFDWFKDDFVSESGSVIAFVNPYMGGNTGSDFKIEYTNYDWTLNDLQ